ncbi:MAG: terpene cyclase/mutase family protein [Bifidobacteriaceae bacterium]|jgi:prenyltransferase beta subunit|nr:terpene cyclase/mutase family protein [Bifidobacteriaceae bacterium]
MMQFLLLPECGQAYKTIKSYQNDDGGWGEHRTQSSRLTNTCEAIWALARIGEDWEENESAINVLIRGLRGENPETRQNASKLRDYAWSLIALEAMNEEPFSSQLQERIDSTMDSLLGMTDQAKAFAVDSDALTDSPFIVSIVLHAFEGYCGDRAEKVAGKIERLLGELVSAQNPDGGWSSREIGKCSDAAGTAYAFCAIARNAATNQISSDAQEALRKAIHYLHGADLNEITTEVELRTVVPPYRHYTRAWALMGFGWLYQSGIGFEDGKILLGELLAEYSNGGWSIFNLEGEDAPLLWATSLAVVAILTYCQFVPLAALLGGRKWLEQKRARIFAKLLPARSKRPWLTVAIEVALPAIVAFVVTWWLCSRSGLSAVGSVTVAGVIATLFTGVVGAVGTLVAVVKGKEI